MDIFLLIIVIILAVLLFIVNIYLLAVYCHPEDRGWGSTFFCKILVVLGLTLSWAQVLVLPLDVANSQGSADAGFNVETLWIIIYMTIMVMVCILIPFAMFMYEDDDEKGKTNRLFTAICYSLTTFAIIAAILFITFIFWRTADIPLTIITQQMPDIANMDSSFSLSNASQVSGQTVEDTTIEYKVSFPIYCMALMAFVGWWLFAIFGGVGLSALPMDLIRDFAYRPQMRSTADAREMKNKLKGETERLIELGKTITDEEKDVTHADGFWSKRKAKNSVTGKLKKFKIDVFNLEKNYSIFKLELKYLDHNPLIFIGKFILGILFSIVSLMWWLHIILFVLVDPPASGFLNDLLIGLEGAGFLATTMFAFLSLYLLWCTTKGTLKMGMRILCFTIHPMKVNETWMNSFLFNIQLILLSSVAVTQFCSVAFSQYARLTDIDMMFNGQIQYLRFFTYFNQYHVFEYILVIWSALVAVFLGFKAPKRDGVFAEIDALKKQKFKK